MLLRRLLRVAIYAIVTASFVGSAFSQQADSTALGAFLTKQGYRAIPLSKYPTGHLYTDLEINGVHGKFILDTGAGSTVVEEKRQSKFKMSAERSDEQGVGAGGGGLTLQSSLHNSLHIGKFKMENFSTMLMNLDHVNNTFRALGFDEVDGVIGADILTSGRAIIDYANLIIYLK